MSKSFKIKLDTNYDFLLLGLVTAEPIYKISWQVNEHLNILLKEATPLQVYHSKKQLIQEFAMFSFVTPDELNYYLIHNKGNQGLLVEEQKQIDYWLKIEDTTLDLKTIAQKIKSIKNISLALEVEPGSLKSKNRLIFSDAQD